MRRAAIGLLTAALVLGAGATAHASSIVFVRDGDVWLTAADGSREHRVTADGAYTAVTQSDDGTIFAHANGVLHRLDRNGRRLGSPVGTGVLLGLDASPDGATIAYWYAAGDGPRVSAVAGDGGPSGYDDQSGWHPSWAGDDVILYSNGAGYIATLRPGLGGWSFWFADPDGRKHDSAITRAGDRIAVVVRDYDGAGPWSVAHYANSAPAPRDGGLEPPPAAERPVLRCTVAAGPSEPRDLTWSPDGTALAWTQGGGVIVEPAGLDGCGHAPGGFTIPGASSPDWGPAGLPAAGVRRLPTVTVPRGQRLRRALAKGLRVRVRCTGACAAGGRLRLGRTVVARGSRRLGAGRRTLTLRFTRAGRRTLLGKRRAALRLTVDVSAGGSTSRRTRTVVLTR